MSRLLAHFVLGMIPLVDTVIDMITILPSLKLHTIHVLTCCLYIINQNFL